MANGLPEAPDPNRPVSVDIAPPPGVPEGNGLNY
jgi:hypothetical protein